MIGPLPPHASKDDWRSWARRRRSELDFAEVSKRVVAGLRHWKPLTGTVLVYLALPDEADLTDLGNDEGLELVVTRTPPHGPLTIHPMGSPRERHTFGFEQPVAGSPEVSPEQVGVALVPGLAFDRSGTRLGRGAGYFDELLGRMAPTALLVGVAPAGLVVADLPHLAGDVPMTHLATEEGVQAAERHLSPPTQRVADAAEAGGLFAKVREFPEGTKTSQDAAQAIGCEVSAIVKSLVFMVDGDAVIALLPGDLRLDTFKLVGVHGGARARRATLEEVREATGYAAGGTPPFGHAGALTVYADPGLRRHRWVWAAAGTPTTVFPIGLDELVKLSGARWADLAER